MKTQINEQTQNANNIQVRIVARKKRILDDDVVITQDNNLRIGEIIAVATIKTVMCRSGKNLYWLYDGLIQDCKRRADVNHIYSDGYDIAQTAALFLCEHIGKQLGDTYITACGKVITIKQACFSQSKICNKRKGGCHDFRDIYEIFARIYGRRNRKIIARARNQISRRKVFEQSNDFQVVA